MRRTSCLRPHAVADAAHRQDELRAELAAQPVDVHLHSVTLDLLSPAIQPLLNLRAREYRSRTLHQKLQQRKLTRRECNLDAVLGDAVRGRIERHAEMLEGAGGAAGLASQQGANARRQLVEVEWLREVVVGTRVESQHAIGDRIARGDDEDGQRLAAGSQGFQQLQAVRARKSQVEQQQLEGLVGQCLHRSRRLVDPVDGESLALEAGSDGLADHRIVLYQQQSHVQKYRSWSAERLARTPGTPAHVAGRTILPAMWRISVLSGSESKRVERLLQDAGTLRVALGAEDAV